MKKRTLIQTIDDLIQLEEVYTNSQLLAVLKEGRDQILSDEPAALGRLSQALSLYLMQQAFQAPKAVVEFATAIAKAPHQERGKGAVLKMLALSFLGLNR